MPASKRPWPKHSLIPDHGLEDIPVWWKLAALAFVMTCGALAFRDSELARLPERRALFLQRVNINTATQAELDALPGIGPALAEEVIQERPFENTEDLERVRGIGPGLLRKLQPMIRATDELPAAQ